jgi:hypothetical protein
MHTYLPIHSARLSLHVLLRRLSSDYAVVLFATWYIDCFPCMHTHHLLCGVLTQYLSRGPCFDVVDFGLHRDRLWLMLSHESRLPCLRNCLLS